MEWDKYDEYFRQITKTDKDFLAYMRFDDIDIDSIKKQIFD